MNVWWVESPVFLEGYQKDNSDDSISHDVLMEKTLGNSQIFKYPEMTKMGTW